MLPKDIVEFIHGPQIMAVGTRSEKLRPAFGRPIGAIADAASDRVSFFLPRVQCEPHLTNIANNGWVAFVATDAKSHKNYQLKGHVVDVRPSTPADVAVRDVCRDKLMAYFRQYFIPFPDDFIGKYIVDPSMTITFRVTKIFNQMPGPKAGQPIEFSPAQE